MEEYLEYMKTLRSYMNDVEAEAARRTADEQRQLTEIDTLLADLEHIRLQTVRINEESDAIGKEKGQVAMEIVEKHKKISSLEVECSTLKQTLELLHQEISSTSSKLQDKRLCYTKMTEDMISKLQQQQEWLSEYKKKMSANEPSVGKAPSDLEQTFVEGETSGMLSSELSSSNMEVEENSSQAITNELQSVQRKMEEIEAERSALLTEIWKVGQMIEQEKQMMSGLPPALQEMDLRSLEEEHNALLGDKAGEAEYMSSLQARIDEFRGVSDVIKCRCGLEFKVELSGGAPAASS